MYQEKKCKPKPRRCPLFGLVMLLVMGVCLLACQGDTLVKNSYRTLVTAAATYNVVMETAADAHAAGELSDQAFEQLKDHARVYYNGYQRAVDVLKEVAAGVEAGKEPDQQLRERLSSVVGEVQSLIDELFMRALRQGLKLEGVDI